MKESVLAGLLAIIVAVPVSASDSFAAGSMDYAAGRYEQARNSFEQDIKTKPNWKSYYYLANCFLQLKDAENAKKAYEACLALKPAPDVKLNCERALSFLKTGNVKVVPAKVVPARPIRQALELEQSGDDKATPLDIRRQQILDDAERQANKVREETKEKIEELKTSSNQLYRYADGSVRTDADQDEVSKLSAESEERINRIMQNAKSRAAALK